MQGTYYYIVPLWRNLRILHVYRILLRSPNRGGLQLFSARQEVDLLPINPIIRPLHHKSKEIHEDFGGFLVGF